MTGVKTVLVTGATGKQGGATARHLLADGWHVRALVRDPAAPAAERLAAAGAELAVGDMADRASLDKAAVGVHGVFSIQPLGGSKEFAQVEVEMGVNVAQAAAAAGARHLVYTSVGGADRDPVIWHWRTKTQIEDHVRTLGLPYTILRPVMFMENHASRVFGVASPTALIRMIPPRTALQLIAVDDIGALAALVFADPDRFAGQELEIAGDEMTRDQLVAAMNRALGRTLNTDPVPRELLVQLGLDAERVDQSTETGGWQADIPALRELYPGLKDFESWLAAGGAAQLGALFT